MNNQLTKGQIINNLMCRLPATVNPFDMDEHLLDIVEGIEDIAYCNSLSFIDDCHDMFCE